MNASPQERAPQKANGVSQPAWPIRIQFVLFAGLIPPFLLIGLLRLHLSFDLTKYYIGFVAGAGLAPVAKRVLGWLLSERFFPEPNLPGEDSKIYSLKHGVLNIDVGQTQMWMNMGYWKGQSKPVNFQHACQSLLQEILFTAGLYSITADCDEGTALPSSQRNATANIVDIGFGCGDQALALQKLLELGSYIGLTIDRKQFAFAQQRLGECGFLTDVSNMLTQVSDRPTTVRQIFHADAAKPESWSKELRNAITGLNQVSKANQHGKNWVLALDVLYHLAPSRLSLFRYVCHDLHASIMAFDLLLPNPQQGHLTRLQTYLLRLVSSSTSTPYSNFLTPAQYRAELVSAGYLEEDIEIRDISEYVFGPLVEFMTWQDRQLMTFGLGIGAFHAARWVFGWWARTGIVRGCIVVARARD